MSQERDRKMRPEGASPVRMERLEERLLLSLIGVQPQLDIPTMPYNSTGIVNYDAATESFDCDATPLAIRLAPTTVRIIQTPRDFDLNIKVDSAGNLIGGTEGHDLVVEGVIDVDGDGTAEYDGVLLTGEIKEFGWFDSGVMGGADQFDFRFSVTGGQLADLFAGQDVGIWMLSPTLVGSPQFTGDFTSNFTHKANGLLGAIEATTPPAAPSTISGFVYEDFNNDGAIDFNEYAIEGTQVSLLDADGQVLQTAVTDANGLYVFNDVAPGTYSLQEAQPAGYDDGIDSLGEIGGTVVGTLGNDSVAGITIGEAGGVEAINYNFGERPVVGATVAQGQTATIGFWQNKNGQRLLNSVNEGLGSWLATTLPNLYGASSAQDLSGLTNAEVAQHFRDMFKSNLRKGKSSEPAAKLECQVMAVAFATYVTNANLAGTVGQSFGFLVTDNGVGNSVWNVEDSGEVFGVADYTEVRVIDLLIATDTMTTDGVLYMGYDVLYRSLANDVFTAINEAGDI
jgi:hypothetical protein